ncbi:MFS-type transporter involved in bile tolerance (Atg22 family) [Enterococcus sp. PF1-24]|nr:MFS-type transporter involved in bile tolerance (Atg22 family) [Enterococcus sp. PFB1-1]MDH6402927.1 MFS-type transporter involved in bile tolerance (Atg22 family) [Enterococcus sp. PF1-24]
MYDKWIKYTNKHPYLSVIIIAVISSVLGISVEYMINRQFTGSGFGVTIIFILWQLVTISKSRKVNK